MSTIAHDELIESLAELRQALPSMRFGQLIANMATVARGTAASAVWDMEDDELLTAIRWQLRQHSQRAGAGGAEQNAAPVHGGVASLPGAAPPQSPRQVS